MPHRSTEALRDAPIALLWVRKCLWMLRRRKQIHDSRFARCQKYYPYTIAAEKLFRLAFKNRNLDFRSRVLSEAVEETTKNFLTSNSP